MTVSGTARRSGIAGGRAAQLSASVRYALAGGLLLVGIGNLAAIDWVLLPRYLATPFAVDPPRRLAAPRAPVTLIVPQAAPLPLANPEPRPAQPPPADVAASSSESDKANQPVESQFPHLLFDRNTNWLSPSARETLARVAAALAEDPGRRVILSGHTDDLGPEDINRALSMDRARKSGRWLERVALAVRPGPRPGRARRMPCHFVQTRARRRPGRKTAGRSLHAGFW